MVCKICAGCYSGNFMQEGRLINKLMPNCTISKTMGRVLTSSDVGKLVVRVYPFDHRNLHNNQEGCLNYDWSLIPCDPSVASITAIKLLSVTEKTIRPQVYYSFYTGPLERENDGHWLTLDEYTRIVFSSPEKSSKGEKAALEQQDTTEEKASKT